MNAKIFYDERRAFAKNLRRITASLGITQAKLAAQLGVTQPTVSGWIRGVTSPSPSRLAQLSTILDVSPEVLMPAYRAEEGNLGGQYALFAKEDAGIVFNIRVVAENKADAEKIVRFVRDLGIEPTKLV